MSEPNDLVIELEDTVHCLRGDYFDKLEPLIDDAIRDCYVAVTTNDDLFIPAFTTFHNLVCDLFRHAEPPKADDPKLTMRQIEGVILGLKGHPLPTLTEKEREEQPPLKIDSVERVVAVMLASERRQAKASLRRLLETTRHAPIDDD